MKEVQIIGRLREKYSNKYIQTPNKDKDHYISWLQDEYAELAMSKANGAEQSSSNCNIPLVMPSVYGIFKHGMDKVYGYYWNLEVAEEVCAEMKGEDYYVDELCVDEH